MAKTRKNRSRKATRKDKKQKKTRKGSSWTDAVKRVYEELKRKNRGASLGDAMREASLRKKAGTL